MYICPSQSVTDTSLLASKSYQRLRQSVHHYLLPVTVKISPAHGDAGQNGVSYPKRVPGVWGSKALGSKKPFVQLPDAGYTLAI